MRIRKDPAQPGVYYFDPEPHEKEVELLKEALAELQEREKQRDPAWKPKVDLKERLGRQGPK